MMRVAMAQGISETNLRNSQYKPRKTRLVIADAGFKFFVLSDVGKLVLNVVAE